MAELLIRRPGLLTTVQDLGRPGLGRFGVSPSGAMDPFALRVANRLVGNRDGAAALEITATGPEIEFLGEATLALAGANLEATLDGVALEPWAAAAARAGAVLRFGRRRHGARAYLAVAGGIVVPEVLGSAATDLDAGVGGVAGRPLRAGDRLALGPAPPTPMRRARLAVRRVYADPFTLRFVPAPRAAIPPTVVAAFAGGVYRVSTRSNRTGYRLEGAELPLRRPADALSTPVPPGAIQLPPDGHPILLMADRPTVGGYPLLGCVIAADAPKAAQLWVGHEVRFRAVGVAEARAAWREQQGILAAAVTP